MLSSGNAAVAAEQTATPSLPVQKPAAAELSLDLLELELALNDFNETEMDFAQTVGDEVRKAGGDFLFELPASGLAENCKRIAAIRIPETGSGDLKVVFAFLDKSGTGVRVENADEKTADLKRFADAFVGVLERFSA